MILSSWRVYLFGFSILMSLLMFFFVIFKRGRELYFDEESLLDEVFFLLFYGLIGGRAMYVAIHADRFVGNLTSVINVFGNPGLFYPGIFFGGLVAFVFRSRDKKWDIFVAADILAVGWALLYSLISLSMLVGGVGYGIATSTFLGMHFPGVYDLRHPVQIYEAIVYGMLFVWLWKLEDVYRTFGWYKAKKSEANSGFISSVFLIFHAFSGLLFTQLKPASAAFAGIRIDSILYLVMLLLGVYILHIRSGKGLMQLWYSGKDAVIFWKK